MRILRKMDRLVVGFLLPYLFAFVCLPFTWRRIQIGDARKIAIILTENLGDIIITSALLRELRKAFPSAEIVAVILQKAEGLIECCPYIDGIVALRPATSLWQGLRRAIIFGWNCLKKERFDLAIHPRSHGDDEFSALLSVLTMAPHRLTLDNSPTTWQRLRRFHCFPFFTNVLTESMVKHETDRRLDIVRPLGRTDVEIRTESWLDDADVEFAERFLTKVRRGREFPVIAFGVGASHPIRRWPIDRYAQVIDALGGVCGAASIIIAGPGEEKLVEEALRLTNGNVFVPSEPTVRQTIAVIAGCSLFVGNDSGPMHFAASVGVPVVEISCHPKGSDGINYFYGPERFGPLGQSRILQPEPIDRRCANGCVETEAHCILNVSVDAVVREALFLLHR